MTGRELLEKLRQEIVVGDGAMGTMLHAKGIPWEMNFDSVNLLNPSLVKSLHEEYLQAGAQFIETNTFGANANKLAATDFARKVSEVNRAGAKIAREAAGKKAWVAGSVGPLGKPRIKSDENTPPSEDEKIEIFREQIKALAEGGVDCLILESFPSFDELKLALRAAKSITDIPVICQIAILDRLDQHQESSMAKSLLELIPLGADCIGGNCGSGPAYLLNVIQRLAPMTDSLISAFPNLSFPQYLEGRFVFISDPAYFAESASKFADAGATLIGGCCGTTPLHIKLIHDRLAGRKTAKRTISTISISEAKPASAPASGLPQFPDILQKTREKCVVIVELDPPRGLGYEKVLEGAQRLAKEGADAISLAENPLASIRMSPFVLGHLIQKEVGLLTIPHCTCRDRNLLGQQAELMGAWALGITHLLAITGDPTSIGGALGCSSVFDTNSFGLIEMITKLNQGLNIVGTPIARPTDFTIGCAFDPNKVNLDAEIKRLKKKIAFGAQFAQSQIVYSTKTIQEMYAKTKTIGIPIYCGIMPMVSHRNAEFLHNEVPGFKIPDEARQRMKSCNGNKEKEIEVGLEIARELIDTALAAGAPGIYMVTPFNKWETTLQLTHHIHTRSAARVG